MEGERVVTQNLYEPYEAPVLYRHQRLQKVTLGTLSGTGHDGRDIVDKVVLQEPDGTPSGYVWIQREGDRSGHVERGS